MLTQTRLKEVLRYDAETGLFYWLVNKASHVHAGDLAGRINNLGYVQITVDKRFYYAHRLAWLYVHGKWPIKFLDHIDRNPSNNRLYNLREATNAENHINAPPRPNSKSGIKGVFSYKGKWRATLASKYIGSFNTKEEAQAAYLAAAQTKYGEFACDA